MKILPESAVETPEPAVVADDTAAATDAAKVDFLVSSSEVPPAGIYVADAEELERFLLDA